MHQTYRYEGPREEAKGDESDDPHRYGFLFGFKSDLMRFQSDLMHLCRHALHFLGRYLGGLDVLAV